MPQIDGFLKSTLPDLSRSRPLKPSATNNTYESVNFSGSSSGVVGTVVNQYFYGGQPPSVQDAVDIEEDGGSRSVELRSTHVFFSEAISCLLIAVADNLSKV